MTGTVQDRVTALTERERATLRLIVRGHDAKSIARHLGLSVHTINERLRDARRKLSVSSSREAARLLLEWEEGAPQSPVPDEIGEAPPPPAMPVAMQPDTAATRRRRLGLVVGGTVMASVLGFLLLAALSPQATAPEGAASSTAATAEAADPAVEAAARRFLGLVDAADWDGSYAMFGAAFRKLNSTKAWTAASEKARAPLGPVRSRTLISQQDFPAPPRGYEVVKFRTSFANKADAVETVTLDREASAWRVVGVWIE